MNENKNEGKVKILEMLAEGKITVEQSLELLAQFNEDEKKSKHAEYTDPRQINPNKHPHIFIGKPYNYEDEDFDSEDFGAEMSNLGRRIKESVEDAIGVDFTSIGRDLKSSFEDLADNLDDIDVDIHVDLAGVFGYYKHKSTITYISDPIPQSINQLKLLGKNSSVQIVGYDGDRLRITCKYIAKRPDAQVVVNEDSGSYEVLYDYNAMRSMQIYAEVPRVFIENIHGESKNSSVTLSGIRCRHAHLLTKNSSIRVEHVDCEEITARTRNSAIKAEELAANSIDFETSNSKISLEDTMAHTARLTTTNSKVATENCDIKQLFIKTSNAGIKMENIFAAAAKQGDWDSERVIEAHTTNGGVSIYIPRDVAAMVNASTSHGRVDCNLPNMLLTETSKNYFSGKNANYDSGAKKVKVNISTTNSTVKIREA